MTATKKKGDQGFEDHHIDIFADKVVDLAMSFAPRPLTGAERLERDQQRYQLQDAVDALIDACLKAK